MLIHYVKFYVIYNTLSFFTEKYEKSPLLIFSPPTFVMTEECVDNFVLSLDAIIRVGGAISNDECDDAEQINAAARISWKEVWRSLSRRGGHSYLQFEQ